MRILSRAELRDLHTRSLIYFKTHAGVERYGWYTDWASVA
jgi:hypothetical protein